jgi:PAS domain S-box-containing protein
MAEPRKSRASSRLQEASRIRQAEAWFRLLIENVEDHAVFLLDRDGSAVSWNPGVQRVLGYDQAEFLGLPFERLFGPEDHWAAQRDIERARTLGRAEEDRLHVRTGGRHVWARGVLLALRDADHQLHGYTYVMHDRAAGQRSADGRREPLHREYSAQAGADRANQTKDAFLAAVSHELRTPLNAILGWAHLLAEGHLGEGQAARAIHIIARNAKLQARVIDDLLDASRIMTDTLELDVHVLTWSSVVRAAVESVQPDASAKAVRVALSGTDDLEPIEGDATRLRRALVEVLANAIKATPANGVITVTVGRTDHEVELTVRDTGVGLQTLSHIVDRKYQRGEPGHDRRELGLGLIVAGRIIEAHGGTIAAASEGAGTGTTFTIRLPSARDRQTAAEVRARAASPTKACPPALAGLCALVVEDQADSRELVDAVLGRCGMRVIPVDSVFAALEALDSHSVDVIISDIGLASEDGLTLMRRVRGRPASRGGTVPAIAVSAYDGADDRLLAEEAGYQTYLVKPLDPAEVIAAVAILVRAA